MSKELEFFIDPFFISSWASFRNRNLLKRLVFKGYILESYFDLYSSDKALSFLREMLEGKKFIIYRSYDYSEEFENAIKDIIEEDSRISQMSDLGIKILSYALKDGIRILTDDFVIHKFAILYWNSDKIWSSYNLLHYMYRIGLINNFEEELKAFCEDTNIVFLRLEKSLVLEENQTKLPD